MLAGAKWSLVKSSPSVEEAAKILGRGNHKLDWIFVFYLSNFFYLFRKIMMVPFSCKALFQGSEVYCNASFPFQSTEPLCWVVSAGAVVCPLFSSHRGRGCGSSIDPPMGIEVLASELIMRLSVVERS